MDFMATLTWRPTLGWIPGPGGHASVHPAVLAAPETPPPEVRNFTKDSVVLPDPEVESTSCRKEFIDDSAVLSAPETPPPALTNFTKDSAGLSAPETPPPAVRNFTTDSAGLSAPETPPPALRNL